MDQRGIKSDPFTVFGASGPHFNERSQFAEPSGSIEIIKTCPPMVETGDIIRSPIKSDKRTTAWCVK